MRKEDVISLSIAAVNKLVYKAPHKHMPNRIITEYWSLDGVLLKRIDPLESYESIIA